MLRGWLRLVPLIAALALGTPAGAHAQGRPAPPATNNERAAPAPLDISGYRTFVAWIADAEVLEPGTVLLSAAATRWHSALSRDTGMPSLSGSVGITPRLQIGASFERYTSSYADGTRRASFGDSYIIGKVVLADANTYRAGVAVSPIVQILSNDSLEYYRYHHSAATGRIQWALPVHAQMRIGPMRAYASAGYFSVGGSFAGAAIDAPVNNRLTITATVSHSYATTSSTSAERLGVSRHRSDAGGGVSIVLSPSVFAFGAIGRTISHRDENSMTLAANAGIALLLRRRVTQP